MSTVQKLQAAVQQLAKDYISKAKTRRFLHGVAVLSLEEFSSLNAAGRRLSDNRFSGENRMRRAVTDSGLADQLQSLLVAEAFGDRAGYLYCSMDHSQFGPFCIAVLAVSVRKGRAIPVWIQVNVSEAALILPLLTALELLLATLQAIAPALKPVFVMDRWFASDKLLTLFENYGAYFITRTKSDKKIVLPWDPSWWRTPIQEVSHLELVVTYRSHKLRLIRSELRSGMKDPEPWFLLTNLPDEITRRQILNRHKERFEIEEAFKDVKWLQRLEWQRVKKPAVMRTLLLFVFLGWWLLKRYVDPELAEASVHPKKQLSWFRRAWEYLQRLLRTPLLPPQAIGLQGGVKK
jgi:Transposase DDE domain